MREQLRKGWTRRGVAVVALVVIASGLSLEVDTELGSPESSRRWVRVLPCFVEGDDPIPSEELGRLKSGVIRERWSLFGLVHQKNQIIFVCRFSAVHVPGHPGHKTEQPGSDPRPRWFALAFGLRLNDHWLNRKPFVFSSAQMMFS